MSDDLVGQLQDDIQTLIDNLTAPASLEKSRIRSVSTSICRRWLIDKGLSNLAHTMGVCPTLPALDNTSHIFDIEKWKHVEFYTLGGVSLEGFPINSIYRPQFGFPGNPNFVLPKLKEYSPAKFLNRKCSFGQRTWFTTENVLRYMANKAGGVHFDTKREKDIDRKIDVVREKYTVVSEAGMSNEAQSIQLVIAGTFEEQFDFCYLEMISIAQSLCNVRFDGKPVVHKLRLGEDETGFGDDILLGHGHHRRIDLPN